MNKQTLFEIKQEAREVLREEYNLDETDISEAIHEVADTSTPIYTGDLMQLAADNLNLATDEPELGPAFDGSPTPINIIAANIYEAIEADLWGYYREELEG